MLYGGSEKVKKKSLNHDRAPPVTRRAGGELQLRLNGNEQRIAKEGTMAGGGGLVGTLSSSVLLLDFSLWVMFLCCIRLRDGQGLRERPSFGPPEETSLKQIE